jgi:hypothetical protein
MFDIDQSIAEWRQQMLAAGIKTPVPLEELESHLREDFDVQIRDGTAPERAFEIAARRLGLPVALRQEFCKVGTVMPAWARKMNYTVSAMVTVLFCAVGLIFLFNIHILHSHVAPGARVLAIGERISIAGAFLSTGLLLSAWRFLWRYLPVLLRPRTRIAAVFLCAILSGLCATILLRFLPLGAGTSEELAIAALWACEVPLAAACAFTFGLEEAAYRKMAMSDL